ncbi:MAG: Gfo/Idh/MocA family protein, partial [Pleurocapsa sp.]
MSLKVGIVGTGYAAKKRAESLQIDKRAELLAFTGNSPQKIHNFAQTMGVSAVDSWQQLVNLSELDLIFVCTINRDCGAIAHAAVTAGKHVVVEYPLATDPQLAADIIELANKKNKLLHVEHIELIGGLHQTIKQYLPEIGKVFYARYATISPQHPVTQGWKYHREMFGFPLIAALSRVNRFTDLFGNVDTVTCQNRYWHTPNSPYFNACLCQAQLQFSNDVVADLIYGKGDVFWQGERTFEINGETGKLIFEGEIGKLVTATGSTNLKAPSRRGLFAKDTTMVLDCLLDNKPLYLQPQDSLYALQVAAAARKSVATNQVIDFN